MNQAGERSSRELATIVGVATGTPDGGVAIVRVSGPRARELAGGLAGSLPPPRHLGHRRLRGHAGELAGESALVVFMPGPHSFTGEDVVELHVHGGVHNVGAIVDELIARGATAAGPGDFSRRAFVHGRVRLDQLEGMAAVIGAETRAAMEQARRLVAGELGIEVDALGQELHAVRVEVEAQLDFPDEVGAATLARWSAAIDGAASRVEGWLAGFEAGQRARSGVRVVLAGPPNAGKSALFNALLGRPRALVSEEAGTTRDYVEASVEIDGRRVTLVDTAGVRDAPEMGATERAGVANSLVQLAGAELVLWIEGADTLEVASPPAVGGEVIRVENKRDLGVRRGEWIGVSAATGEGVGELETRIAACFASPREAWIGLARHRDRASEALAALRGAAQQLRVGGGLELVAFELQIAQARLREICARHDMGAVGEEILDGIFSRFCIGK